MNEAEIIKLALQGAAFVAEAIAAFINGDDSEAVRRVIDVLDPELRATLELARQRALNRAALEEHFDAERGDTEPPAE